MAEKQFWKVIGGVPEVVSPEYPTRAEARTFAKEVARNRPGEAFYVLKAVERMVFEGVTSTLLAPCDDPETERSARDGR